MQIIDMPWEKDNLGVKAIEYRLDGTEAFDEIIGFINDDKYDYQVCRIPANCMRLAYDIQNLGFSFAEAAFELCADLKTDVLPGTLKKYLRMIDYHAADKTEINDVERIIRSGVFDTDRIALDPFFSIGASGRRFGNWYRKELENGSSKCYVVTVEGSPIGFFVLKNISETEADSFLAALHGDNKGLGFSTIYFPLEQARKEGKKKISTRVSSNNLESIKTHLEVGYKIKRIQYLFVKHNK